MYSLTMYSQPYSVVKVSRGRYNVQDAKGVLVLHTHVSLRQASAQRVDHMLQDKALNSQAIRDQVTHITGHDKEARIGAWLYQTLIRFNTQQLREVIKHPKRLMAIHDNYVNRMREKLNAKPDTETTQELTKALFGELTTKEQEGYILRFFREQPPQGFYAWLTKQGNPNT